jgi:hypothetical protein
LLPPEKMRHEEFKFEKQFDIKPKEFETQMLTFYSIPVYDILWDEDFLSKMMKGGVVNEDCKA